MPESLPKGTMKIPAEMIWAEVIPPSIKASRPNVVLISGNITVLDETMSGTRNAASEATIGIT
jgi:hypothetical protein